MSRPCDEIVEFITAGFTSEAMAGFEPSEATKPIMIRICRCLTLLTLLMLAGCAGTEAYEKQSGSLYVIGDGEAFGFIDARGEVVVSPKYHLVSDFDGENWVAQRDDRSWVLVNAEAEEASLTSEPFQLVYAAGDDLYLGDPGDVEDPLVVIDRRRRFALPDDFRPGSYSIREGRLAVIGPNGLYGYANREGDIVIKPQFEAAFTFNDGLAAVRLPEKPFGYVDRGGAMIIEPQFEVGTEFNTGYARVLTPPPEPRSFYIDKQGKRVSELVWEKEDGRYQNSDVHEGLAAVAPPESDLWGYINQNGKIVIEPAYGYAGEFSDGFAFVVTPDRTVRCIDSKGRVAFTLPEFGYPGGFTRGMAWINLDGKPKRTIEDDPRIFPYGLRNEGYYVNTEGTVIWRSSK